MRERDAQYPKDPVQFAQDRRTLLALYDAQAEEVRRLRSIAADAIHRINWMLQYAKDMDVAAVEADVSRLEAALGSQP